MIALQTIETFNIWTYNSVLHDWWHPVIWGLCLLVGKFKIMYHMVPYFILIFQIFLLYYMYKYPYPPPPKKKILTVVVTKKPPMCTRVVR